MLLKYSRSEVSPSSDNIHVNNRFILFQISFILSGACSDDRTSKVYRDIAKASTGLAFNVEKGNVGLVSLKINIFGARVDYISVHRKCLPSTYSDFMLYFKYMQMSSWSDYLSYSMSTHRSCWSILASIRQ